MPMLFQSSPSMLTQQTTPDTSTTTDARQQYLDQQAARTTTPTPAVQQTTPSPARTTRDTNRVFSPAEVTFIPYAEEVQAQGAVKQPDNLWLLLLGGAVAYNVLKGK